MLLALSFEQLRLFLGCWRRVTLVPKFQSSEGKRSPNPNPEHHGETPDEGPEWLGGGEGAGRASPRADGLRPGRLLPAISAWFLGRPVASGRHCALLFYSQTPTAAPSLGPED